MQTQAHTQAALQAQLEAQDLVTLLAKQFRQLIYIHTPRSQNILADTVASLASSLSFPLSRSVETINVQRLEAPSTQDPWFINLRSSLVLKAERKEAKEILLMELVEMILEERPWYHEIEQYYRDGTFPEEAEVEDRRPIRRAALKYTIISGVLYRRALNGMLLCCLSDEEAWKPSCREPEVDSLLTWTRSRGKGKASM
ncbi:hypothetical protein Taro_036426 [Colocasia esculenta]|uniref:RNase H type-1 domain-containing protein n=1 Tax=Colocasia esculenta TaxID=4460 RepID=A0A843W9Q8_COLES|nr:hypothetical protein [Colocasia esculenta]